MGKGDAKFTGAGKEPLDEMVALRAGLQKFHALDDIVLTGAPVTPDRAIIVKRLDEVVRLLKEITGRQANRKAGG